MSEAIITGISGIFGALVGALVGAWIVWKTSSKAQKQAYYGGLINYLGTHNWNLVSQKLNPGLPITNIPLEISVVCYQHLNLLFYLWLNRDIVEKDGSIKAWKNWANGIIEGAKVSGNNHFRECYHDIFSHKDLYPDEFYTWLNDKLSLSSTAFHTASGSKENNGE